jgi:hypothetical protein
MPKRFLVKSQSLLLVFQTLENVLNEQLRKFFNFNRLRGMFVKASRTLQRRFFDIDAYSEHSLEALTVGIAIGKQTSNFLVANVDIVDPLAVNLLLRKHLVDCLQYGCAGENWQDGDDRWIDLGENCQIDIARRTGPLVGSLSSSLDL